MKNYALGLGIIGALAFSALPAAADCGCSHSSMEMEHSITSHLEAGGLGPGDILSFNQPFELTGTVDSRRTGLVHMTTADGMHLIVPESLSFRQGEVPISPLGLDTGSVATVIIPHNHNWVINGAPNVPFASEFSGQDVILLGGYGGPVWIPRSTLLQADLDFTASSGVPMDDAEAADMTH